MDVLAPDVVLLADGGGLKKAAVRPIHGHDKVARFLRGRGHQGRPDRRRAPHDGQRPARRWRSSSTASVDTLLTILVEDGVVAGLYAVRNPAKLTRLDEAVTLTR